MRVGLGLGIGFGSYINSVWSPRKLGGIALWLRGDLGITTVSGAVSQWNDQSGAGDANHNAAQATALARPTYVASDAAFNNQPTLSFGGAHYLQTGTWSVAPAQPFSLFIVGADNGSNGQAYCDDVGGLDRGEILTIFSQYCIRAGALLPSGDAPAVGARVLGGDFNGGSSNIYNSAKTARASGAAGVFSPTGFTLGASGDTSSRFLTGKIAEVVVTRGVLNATDRGTLFDYFAARYGITIGA